jgi:hypothetical protein
MLTFEESVLQPESEHIKRSPVHWHFDEDDDGNDDDDVCYYYQMLMEPCLLFIGTHRRCANFI